MPAQLRQKQTPRWRSLRLAVCVLVLAGLVGWTAFQAARKAWANSNLRSAHQALDQQDYARAQADLKSCLTYWPDNAELHFLTARTIRRAALVVVADADWEAQAIRELGECERLNYPPEDIALETALLRAMRGELEDVETRLLALLIQKHPDSPLILETLVPVYLSRFQVPRALVCVSQLLAEEPDNAYAYYWRGVVRDLLLSNSQAIADYRRAVELRPSLDKARQRLAENLLVVQRYHEAQEHFERLVERQPDDSGLLLGLARGYHGLGKIEVAKTVLDRLLAAQPANGLALEERGKLAFELGQNDEAERFLRRALQQVPHEAQANYTLYQCLSWRGQKEEAAKYLSRYEQLEADSKRFRKLTELIRASPQNAGMRAKMGTLLLRHDQEAQGLGWLTSTLQIDPCHPAANQALADYYVQHAQANRAEHHRQLAAQGMFRLLENLSLPLF